MNNFMNKARSGRTIALAGRIGKSEKTDSVVEQVVQFKSSRGFDPLPFISNRAQPQSSTWLH